ncbi:hypothetical protein SK803_45005 [Lentzea sp. BCCO 10_0856]|uniref:Alkylmercury lyase n=1 Tax=Lentzea miocenica TaxID=3095431 RepID=A0ABU4TGS9_9PSEU|nr:hypothetical protein [Lentzea sp. BCCO 10_0856]MDX8037399.1 hypothetical protein [Lentzea sp. BCCO 10_0856]
MTDLALLAEAADRGGPQAIDAIMRAAAVVVSGKDEVREAGVMSRLCTAANRLLPDSTDAYYPYLLECALAFEGVGYWADDLAWAVAGEEYCLPCPACRTELVIYDDTCTDETGASRPLVPADPARLTGIGRRLYDTATGHDRDHVAQAFLRLFGRATCPACEADLTIAEAVL